MNLFDWSTRMGLADPALPAVPYGTGKSVASLLLSGSCHQAGKHWIYKPVFSNIVSRENVTGIGRTIIYN